MPKITFLPADVSVEVNEDTKILAAAIKNKITISFGCGACQCGMCFMQVSKGADISPMDQEEEKLLKLLEHTTDGSTRLACKTKILSGDLVVDLSKNLGT